MEQHQQQQIVFSHGRCFLCYSVLLCLEGRTSNLGRPVYSIKKHWGAGEEHELHHVVIAILGRFKGETGESYHLMPIVARTERGLEPRKWMNDWSKFMIAKALLMARCPGTA